MDEPTIKLTIAQLQSLLDQQTNLTIEQCMSNTSYYNTESVGSEFKSLPIDKAKFRENGLRVSYPQDFNVLKKYIK